MITEQKKYYYQRPRADRRRQYYGKKPWMKQLKNLRCRCNRDNLPTDLTHDNTRLLWERDGGAQMVHPCLVRKDLSQGFFFDNCQFIEFSSIHRKGVSHG